MENDQAAFLRELLNDFRIEAAEHYQAILSGILELEKDAKDIDSKAIIEKTFREIHSLKGAARAVNLLDIEKLCMSLEAIFHGLKKGELALSPPSFNVLYKALDILKKILDQPAGAAGQPPSFELVQVLRILDSILQSSRVGPGTHVPAIDEPILEKPAERPADPNESDIAGTGSNKNRTEIETTRISTTKLYDILRQAEEMVTVKSTMRFYVKEMQEISDHLVSWNRKNIGISDKEFRKKHETELLSLRKNLEQFHRATGQTIDNLLIDIKATLLFPFSSLLAVLPKIVRDLSKQFDKEIDLAITGGDIEIDRRILEDFKDPLIHLIRNCIDHGIESKNERLSLGKKSKALIRIQITKDLNHNVQLVVSDDGSGIDREKVIRSAVKAGLIRLEDSETLTDEEVYALICSSGISTSTYITDISGRGLGMAIVAEKVAKLGGSVGIHSIKGKGTQFLISLPQTLATFRGILTRVSDQLFIIPTTTIVCALHVLPTEIKSVESRQTVVYNGETIALASLADVLHLPVKRSRKKDKSKIPVIILSLAQKKIALVVDEVLEEQEGIVKDLGPQLPNVTNIEGVTILGSGQIVPILHISDLIESAIHSTVISQIGIESMRQDVSLEDELKTVLVAEDSFTVRSMLKNFIENAGYVVVTAIDGQEAYDHIQTDLVDIVVSDIEMPRMNGFELTSKIRSDSRFGHLPVILVTALDSADDRKLGLESGANAYIVKGSFEQSNLIETIKRLI